MGKHLTEKERYLIEFMYNKEKRTQREIAKILNKHYNTIYNEIKRGTIKQIDTHLKEYYIYCADVGQRKYIEANARKGANNKVACDSEYLLFIRDKVKQHYSFYSANELAKQEGFNTRVCLTTLYNYFNKHFIKLKKLDMPYNKIKKVKQEKETKRVYQYGKRSIDERGNLQQRDIYGHWEMDTVQGQKKKKAVYLFYLNERHDKNYSLNLIINSVPVFGILYKITGIS